MADDAAHGTHAVRRADLGLTNSIWLVRHARGYPAAASSSSEAARTARSLKAHAFVRQLAAAAPPVGSSKAAAKQARRAHLCALTWAPSISRFSRIARRRGGGSGAMRCQSDVAIARHALGALDKLTATAAALNVTLKVLQQPQGAAAPKVLLRDCRAAACGPCSRVLRFSMGRGDVVRSRAANWLND